MAQEKPLNPVGPRKRGEIFKEDTGLDLSNKGWAQNEKKGTRQNGKSDGMGGERGTPRGKSMGGKVSLNWGGRKEHHRKFSRRGVLKGRPR